MKKLILLGLLIPYFSFAQRFDVSEQAGYSTTTSLTNGEATMSGFSNQVSVGYQCVRQFSVSAFYQFNNWNNHNNAYGLSPEFVTKHFFAGADVQMTTFAAVATPNNIVSYNFKTSWGYGLHLGGKQTIIKGLYLILQVGYDMDNVNYTTESNPGGVAYTLHGTATETLNIWYLRAGLLYRII